MVLFILFILCLALGFIGCFINKVPGPLLVAIGALLFKFSDGGQLMSWLPIIIVWALAIGAMIGSKMLTQKAKSICNYSKAATWAASIVSLIFMILSATTGNNVLSWVFAIVGLTVFPFAAAYLVEMTKTKDAALKNATACELAFLADTGLKLLVVIVAVNCLFDPSLN